MGKPATIVDIRRAAPAGVEITHDPGCEYEAFAPSGSVFRATGTHALVANYDFAGDESSRASSAQGLLEDVADGIEPCPDKDCDICEEHDNA